MLFILRFGIEVDGIAIALCKLSLVNQKGKGKILLLLLALTSYSRYISVIFMNWEAERASEVRIFTEKTGGDLVRHKFSTIENSTNKT